MQMEWTMIVLSLNDLATGKTVLNGTKLRILFQKTISQEVVF